MPMNQVIQQRRRALGFTQEQVADRLGVSAPAVNKWEKGVSCPDVMLLPALARLLEIDLNTLFCFQESLSEAEVARLCEDAIKAAQTDGLDAGFAAAGEALRRYPNSMSLCYHMAAAMDGSMVLSGADATTRERHEAQLMDWYARCAGGDDPQIRDRATFMLAGRCLRQGACAEAQRALDRLPDQQSVDKRLLQAEIFVRQDKLDDAGRLIAQAVLAEINSAVQFLWKLTDIELQAGDTAAAEEIAEISRRAVALFGLWDYSALVAPLSVAVAQRDAGASVRLLRQLLDASAQPWRPGASALYRRIAAGRPSPDMKRMLQPLLKDLETNPDYEFLRADADYLDMIAEYRKRFED